MANSTQTTDTPIAYAPAFQPTLDALSKPLSDLLSRYSNIPAEAQIAHVLRLRDEAYARFPYPCIGAFRFLEFDLAAHFGYEAHVLAPLRREDADAPEPLFLDVGTCFGQDVRRLAFDGVPARRLWASDIEAELVDLGFRMFNDADRLPRSHFLCPGNLLVDSPGDKLRELDGRVTILHLTAVFHLFSLEDQKVAADRCLRLLRKDTGGPVLLLGGQVGSLVAGSFVSQNISGVYTHKYWHNEQSWRDLWQEVVQREEWKDKVKKVEVESKLLKRTTQKNDEGAEVIVFVEPDEEAPVLWHVFEVWVTFT
ncbi:hypothetical protein AAE478_002504 [Parahypoxylon ruwenzoriense]